MWFVLADRMGCPVEELQERMTSDEFVRWAEYLRRSHTDLRSPELQALNTIAYELAGIRYLLRRAPLICNDKMAQPPNFEHYFPKYDRGPKRRINHAEKMKVMDPDQKKQYLKDISRPSKWAWMTAFGQDVPQGE